MKKIYIVQEVYYSGTFWTREIEFSSEEEMRKQFPNAIEGSRPLDWDMRPYYKIIKKKK